MRGSKLFRRDTKSRLIALALSAIMALSGIPTIPARAAETTPAPGTITTVADQETLHRPIDIYGQNTFNAGKITVGKSVDTTGFDGNKLDGVSLGNLQPDTNNFLVTLSQSAQAVGLASKLPVPIDAVFVLDTSGSMESPSNDPRYENMISAANEAIASLLAANDQNRVAVVAFSSATYGEGTSNNAAANVLSELAHYDGDAATAHLQRVDADGSASTNGIYVAGRKSETITTTERQYVQVGTDRFGRPQYEWRDVEVSETVNAYRRAEEGGTNIQAGIALGASLLMDSTKSTTAVVNGKTVTRLPFIILLSDGNPTFSATASNWYDAATVTAAGEQGPGSAPFAGNGFLAAMTAAYYKSAITERYFGENANENDRCNIYTVGVDLESDMSASETALAKITLNPAGEYKSTNSWYSTFNGYWNSYNLGRAFNINVGKQEYRNNNWVYVDSNFNITAASITASKNYVNGLNKAGESMFTGGLTYNDDYFDSDGDAESLNNTFKELVRLIQIKAISLPTDTSVSADFGGYVHFYDPIGEYMEVKDVHGIVADGHFFKGASFAKNMVNYGTENADAAFDAAITTALNGRLELSGNNALTSADIEAITELAMAAEGQLYYNSNDDFENSFCWWGAPYTDSNGDEHVQFLAFAEDDSIEYIEKALEAAKTETTADDIIPAGAKYVCRSYYYYGTAGGEIEPIDDFLLLAIRVQRSLEAPYQETVYASIPGNLLSVDRVLITEDQTKSPVTYESFVQAENPVRIIYEVGLQSDINAQNVAQVLAGTDYVAEKTVDKSQGSKDNYEAAEDTYYFYTNDWDRSKTVEEHTRALAHAGFDVATDNDFYAFEEDTVLYTKNGNTYAPLTDDIQPGATYYYARTYYDWDGENAKNTAGTIFDCTPEVEYIAVVAPSDAAVIAEHTGTNSNNQKYVKAGTYTAYSLSAENDDTVKGENKTGTSTIIAHPMRTNQITDSHYTVFLGNNGRLALTADKVKTAQVTKADADNTVITDGDGIPVTIGDKITYTIKVVNAEGADTTATVTDVVPAGTKLVEGSIDNGGVYDDATGEITWNLSLAKDATTYVSFQVEVTEDALSEAVITINNTAFIKLSNTPEYNTNTTTNPPQGKKVEGADTNVDPEDGVKVGQELRYVIRWDNYTDQIADITITDVVPKGTTILSDRISDNGTYDAASNKVTWTLEDVAPGAKGTVNFVVVVDESAKTPVINGATIYVGPNDPGFITNTTETEVLTGDLRINKTVTGTNGNQDRYFEVSLTTRSAQNENYGALNGTYTVEGSSKIQTIEFKDGKASFEIKHGETITIKELPAGLEVYVQETAVNGYTATYSAADQKISIVPENTVSMLITNTYAVEPTTFTLKGKKTLNTVSGQLGDTVFSFDAYPCDADGNILGDVTNTAQVTVSTADGTEEFVFATKTITAAGTSHYLVKEVHTNISGVTYDARQYLVTVTVADSDDNGVLEVTQSTKYRDGDSGTFTSIDLTNDVLTFTNSYEPAEVTLELTGTKNLLGRELKANEFSFVVTENNVPVSAGIAAANGTITFETITYYKPGEHTYVVTEANGGDTTIDYDTTAYTVYVKVEDVNGHLTITEKTVNGSASDAIVFNNTYKPGEVYINLSGTKNLYQGNLENDNTTPITLEGGEFSFIVDQTDSEGNVITAGVSTANNGAGGSITFAPITVKVRDNVSADYEETLYFEVREAIPTVSKDPYMTYDTTVYKVQAQVTYDYETGVLSVGTPSVAGGNLVFNNIKYPDSITVQPQGTKTTQIAGGTLPDDIYFSFAVKNVETGNTVYTGIAGGSTTSSDIEFTTLTYSTPGTYQYWIAESNSGNTKNGITYDQNQYLMTVIITNTNGKLAASVQYFELNDGATVGSTNVDDYTTAVGTPSFTNEYNAAGYLNITAHKTFNLPMENDQFAFRLQRMASLDVNDDTTTGGLINGISDAAGNVTFATLYYGIEDIPVGEDSAIIRYKMSEIIPTVNPIPGVTYDTNEYNVYVKLTHGLDGVILAELCDANGNALSTGTTDTGITFNNTYVPVSGTTATMTATKELTGRDLALQDGEFTFNLYYVDSNNEETLVDSVENVGANVTFTRNYPNTTAAGTYTYVIRELDGQKGGITYSTAEYWVQVTIEDDTTNAGLVTKSVKYFTDNTFETEITDLAAVKFTNSYEAQDITFTPEATKELTGRTLQDREFYFQIVDMDSEAAVSIGTAAADGTVGFTPIHYGFDASITYPVTYEYAISEIKGSLGGVTYSDAVYYLKVTVSDDGAGKLSVTHGYYSDDSFATEITAQDIVFENTYKTGNGTAQLEATKKLAGRDLEAYEFDFVVVDENGNMVVSGDNDESVKADEESKILFGTIGYNFSDLNGATSKEFTYWMYEVAPQINGITFDQNRFKVVVTVEDDGNGILSTDVKYYSLNAGATAGSTNADDYTTLVEGTPSFENTYAPEPTEIILHAYKELIGKDLVDGEFSFVLKDEDNNEVTATNKDGVASFEKEYTTIGTYEYTISEVQRVNSDKAGTGQYTFDETVYKVVVTVTDDGKGKLHATAEYFKQNSSEAVPGAAFSNSYKPDEIKVDLSLDIGATKTVVGADGEEVEITVSGNKADYPVEGFQFVVKDALDNVVSTGTSNADGTITFTEFTFTQAGDYYYWISEADTDKPGITIDSQVWDLHINIVNNYATGELEVGAVNTYLSNQGATAAAPEFVNTYIPSDVNVTIKANKVLVGRTLKEHEFTFRLLEGDIIVAESHNALDGEIAFNFTVSEPGTHTYKIMEVVPLNKEDGITYDETTVGTVSVNVVDDGTGQLKIDEKATVTINSGAEFTNVYTPPETIEVSVVKIWDDANNQDGIRPASVKVQLWADGELQETVILNEGNGWTYTWTELLKYKYYGASEEITYLVTEETIPTGYTAAVTGNAATGFVITNSYEVEKTSVSVEKVWDDVDNQDGKRPESIVVQLLANDAVKENITLSEENGWAYTWNDLDVYAGGTEITYTVKEDTSTLPTGYTAEVSGDAVNGFVITNTYVPEEVKITVNKIWDDNNNEDNMRPATIQVHLLADGEHIGQTKELSAENGWTAEWTELDKYKDGNLIDYIVLEELIGAQSEANLYEMTAYEEEVDSADANHHIVTITNKYLPETTSLIVNKVWNDANNQDGKRPASVEVTLQKSTDGGANWADVETVILSSANSWLHTWTSLLVLDRGADVDYRVVETNVPDGYTAEVIPDQYIFNKFTITNTYVPEETEISVTKVWNDVDNQDGKRPESATVQLLANDVVKETITLNEANSWTYEWTGLDKYASGNEIRYTVKETNIAEGYAAVVTGTAADGYIVTNTHTPMTTSVSVEKVWKDADNQDGMRPGYIEVQLLADGTLKDTVYLYSENNWAFTWEELDVYADGKEIAYTVQEVLDDETAKHYETTVTGTAAEGYIITNTHAVEKVTFTANKVWDDADNQDGKRPVYVLVELWADDESAGTAVLRESNNWTYTWTNLDKYNNGELITYSVVERAVSGYTTEISTEGNIATITNSYTPENTEISVTKVWNDADNQDGKRPASITVELLADGQSTGKTVALNEANGWTYTWTGLAKNSAGTAIAYTVEEQNVPAGYTSVVSGSEAAGYTVTNSYTPEQISITANKVWDDNDNNDGQRPASVTLHLLADDELAGSTRVLDEASKWEAKWENLDKYKDGKEIVYSVYEEKIEVADGKHYSTTYNRTVDETGNISVTVTNSRADNKIAVSVEKIWDDANNQDGIRPDNVKVTLTGKPEGSDEVIVTRTGEITEANGIWRYTFTDLPEYSDSKKIIYSIEETVPEGYTVSGNKEADIFLFELTNKHTPETTSVSVEKVWNDNDNQDGKRPVSIEVQLLADGNVKETIILNEANNWTKEWTGLAKYDAGTEIKYEVNEVLDAETAKNYTVEVSGNAATGYTITNTHEIEKTEVSVTKVWEDADDQDGMRPASVTVQLKANGVAQGDEVTLNADNAWAHTWTELDVYASGKEITYTVEEIMDAETAAEYTAEVTGTVATGFTITNTHEVEKTEVTVTKVWNDADNQDGVRPDSITVGLLADNERYGVPVVLNEANNWTYTWTELDVFKEGKEVVYTVDEINDVNVSKYYTAEISGDAVAGYIITNTHEVEKTEVKVTKVWNDADNQDGKRPASVNVELLADGAVKDTATLNENNSWTYTWTDLDVYKAGTEIKYEVKEVLDAETAKEYTAEVTGDAATGYIITNTHEIEKTEISVLKVWDDADNQDGKRPASIAVELLANGTVKAVVTLDGANSWTHTWTDLDVYKAGTEIKYEVKEILNAGTAKEYTAETTGDMAAGFTITNTHEVEKTEVKVTKVWNDADNQDGKRPASVSVELLADGAVKDTATLNENNDWTYTWTELDVYKAGTEIKYEVKEVLDAETAKEYTAEVTGDAATGYIITNTHEIEKTEISVLKVWDDADNQDGKRPVNVQAQLYKGTEPIGAPVELSEGNGWTYTWINLDKYENGELAPYTVKEIMDAEVAALYTAEVTGDVTTGFIIKNIHTPEVTSVSVTKVWDDEDNKDNIRPGYVEVQIYANDVAVGSSIVLDEENAWTYTWTNLPKYEAGAVITYTVEETEVAPGYTMTMEKADTGNVFTITNTHVPGEPGVEYKEFTITKKWLDDNNAKGLRPESITVRAYLNGVFVTDIVLSEENNWTATATWIASRDGEEYVWTIEEVAVPNGYVASYDQATLTVTNSLRGLPQTGDTSNVGLFMTTGVMALAGMAVLGRRRKEDEEN